jgi:D-sedoheptulose 7-phosphate isomerase
MRDSTRPTTDLFGQADTLHAAIDLLIQRFDNGGKLLICGNGGSAADCEHIVGELMKGFCLPRRLSADDRARFGATDDAALADQLQYGLPAISLVSHSALITAIANDIAGDMIFAQQVLGDRAGR